MSYLNLLESTDPQDDPSFQANVKRQQAGYDIYSFNRDPAIKFLSVYFGEKVTYRSLLLLGSYRDINISFFLRSSYNLLTWNCKLILWCSGYVYLLLIALFVDVLFQWSKRMAEEFLFPLAKIEWINESFKAFLNTWVSILLVVTYLNYEPL